LIDEKDLPLVLPEVDKYLPTEDGEPPLGRAEDWTYGTDEGKHPLELSTMPGWAGSSWYFFRYMDPKNESRFVGKEAEKYWGQVDLYIGGAEHATGHLLYSRFWTKFLYDRGFVSIKEPFRKMINQGMIQGRSNFVYRKKGSNVFVSAGLKEGYDTMPMHVDVNIVHNDQLDIAAFKKWRPDLADAEFILEDGKYICGAEVEKMSKSKYNVVNPDDVIARYGADTLRLYEMFLGPLEQFKPWNTNGIDGVSKFLKKLWRLFYDGKDEWCVNEEKPGKEELKSLHKAIKKVEEDIERYSFNTSVSTFMICVNELSALKCHKRAILEPLLVILSPYAPHIAEELWEKLGHASSIIEATYPEAKEKYLTEESHEYPVSVNGKMRAKVSLPLDLTREEIQERALADEGLQKWIAGKTPKKVIVVPGKIVNIVV
jgi:leucyl-tRNA synthetase